MNACSWMPQRVTLLDGSQVDSDSEAWRAECEGRHMLTFPIAVSQGSAEETRKAALARIAQRRGPEAAVNLAAVMSACEPAHVLALPNKAQRNRYIDTVRHYLGDNAADHLKIRVVALHEARAASNCEVTSA
uniref:Uncharacterized protein n=1 Tax=Pseudomonas phage Touem01 TaxID=3138548 RepID=A0AAU6W2X5_9VIRU